MVQKLFWDVDTQYDFMMPDGKLYVPEAEQIIPHLERLTKYARSQDIPIWGSVDYHYPGDPEISNQPDFNQTFPLHCQRGTEGQNKIEVTKPLDPLWIDSTPLPVTKLKHQIEIHPGELFFRKQKFDVFSNPNVIPALEILNPQHVFVYGVALDVCNAHAIKGFLQMKKFQVSVIYDATKPIYRDRALELMRNWENQGVEMLKTSQVIN